MTAVPPPEPSPDEPPLPPEPAPALAAVLDPSTLRYHFTDLGPARARVDSLRAEIADAPDEISELIARGDLVDLLRALGDDDALDEAQAALDRAERDGNGAQAHTARVRLARVHRGLGHYAESTPLFTELLADATRFGPVVEAYTRQHAGENDFDQGHDTDAAEHFARALALRTEFGLDEAAESRIALDAVRRRSPS